MPSNRYRSRKSLGSRINKVDSSTTRSEATATPSSVGISTVSSDALAKSAVIQDAISVQSIDATSFSTHAYQPSGAAVQRVPAPLTDIYYWDKVVEGLVELHASGVHGDEEIEDIRNVLSTKAGLVLSPTETEKARIYLTGRLPIPQSSKVYAQWNSNVANQPKLIYWVNTPEYLVESAKKVNGIAYFNIDSASPSINVGDTMKVTETTPELDDLYKVIRVSGDTIESVAYESAYEYKISDSSYNAVTQVATFTIADVELLSNPSLDVNANNWSVVGGATVAFTNTQAYAGGGSLEITPSITQNAVPNVFSNVVVLANTTYRAKAYVKGPYGVNAFPRITEFNVTGNVIANTIGDIVSLSNSWVEVSATREMTAGANTAALSVSYEAQTLSSPDVTFTFETDTLGWNSSNLTSATSNTSVARTGNASAYLTVANYVTQFNTNIGTGANGSFVWTVAVQSDGKILIGGDFTSYAGTGQVNRIARLNADGTLDTAFQTNTGTGADGSVYAVATQSDGKILVGGAFAFTTFNGTTVNRIARLSADGVLDTTFDTNTGTGADGSVYAVATQSDGKIVFGGQFTTFNGTTVNYIARLSSAGVLDTTFDTNTGTGANGDVRAIAVQSDDKIVFGGQFTTFNGTTVNLIARLSADGVLDTTFDTNTGTGANSDVASLAVQSDGKIVLGGSFTTFNGTTVNRIARLNSDGSLDTTFTTNTGTGANSDVVSLAVQSDGKIVLGGAFTTFNGTTVNRIVRLNSDGTLDTAFTTDTGTGADGTVRAIAVRNPENSIILGGSFTSFNTVSINRLYGLVPTGEKTFYAYFPTVLPNVTYGLSGFARVPAASANVNVFARIVEFSDSGASIETASANSSTVVATNSAFNIFHVDHTFSTSVQNAYFGVVVSGNVHIDDIQIKLGGYSSKYYLDEGSFKTTFISSIDSVNIDVGDTVILKETTGAEEMAGHYIVQSVDSTTNTSQLVFTFNGSTSESLENFYNSEDVFVVQGADTRTVNEQNFSPFGKLSEDRYNYVSLGDRQVWGASGYTHSIVSAELRENVATLISLSDHYASPGDTIEVYNLDVALGIESSSGIFDGTHVVRSVIDPKTLTYISDNSDVALTEITTGGAYYIRKNNEIPKDYAVYIEADENTSPVLYSNFDVFEVLGEASTTNAEANITNFSLQDNVVTLVLESFPTVVNNAIDIDPGFLLSATVSIDADSLSGGNANTFNGSFTVQSSNTTSKTITYNLVNANIASEAVTGTVLLEVGARHSELNPTGFSLYDESGKIVARLSSLEFNAFNIGATQITAEGDAGFGDTSINGTLLAEEEATFESLSTFNSDLAIYSTSENSTANLYGSFDQAGYHTVFDVGSNIVAVTNTIVAYSNSNVRSIDILNRFARGLIYSVRLSEATTANYLLSTLHGAFGAGSFKLEKDRNYLFVMSTGSTRVNTATNVNVHLEFVLSDTAPTFNVNAQATPNVVKKVQVRGGTTGTYSDMVLQYTSIDNSPISNVRPINDGGANVASDFRIAADTDIYWMLRWATNTTTRTALNFSRVTTDKNAFFNIYDMGPSSSALVGNIDSDSADWKTTGTAVFAGSGNTIVSRTVTINTSGTKTREGTGAISVKLARALGEGVEQAHPTNTSTPRKGQALFPAFSSVATLSEDLTKPEFTISKLEVFLDAIRTTKGSVLYLGISASTNLGIGANTVPTPVSGSPVLNSIGGLATGIKALSTGGSYYDITPFAPYFQNGTARSLLVGLTNSSTNVYTSSLSNYATFKGSGGASSNTFLRVTYSFSLG